MTSGTTAAKLQLLLDTKEAIAKAIEDRGVQLTNRAKFSTYPDEIKKIKIQEWYTNYTSTNMPALSTDAQTIVLSLPEFALAGTYIIEDPVEESSEDT